MHEIAVWRDRDGFRWFSWDVSRKSNIVWQHKSAINPSKLTTQKILSLFSRSLSPLHDSQLILVNSSRRHFESALSMPVWHNFSTYTELRDLVEAKRSSFSLLIDDRYAGGTLTCKKKNIFKVMNMKFMALKVKFIFMTTSQPDVSKEKKSYILKVTIHINVDWWIFQLRGIWWDGSEATLLRFFTSRKSISNFPVAFSSREFITIAKSYQRKRMRVSSKAVLIANTKRPFNIVAKWQKKKAEKIEKKMC